MKRLTALLLLILSLSGCFSVRSTSSFSYSKLTPEEYNSKLQQNPDGYLIDVRTPSEYRKSHIRQAVNYNFFKFNFGKQVDSLERNKVVFIYCHTCHRSPFCARVLRRKGFNNVYDMKKGFAKWLKKGLPVDTGNVSLPNPY